LTTTASKYTVLFIDQKEYERLILGHSNTHLKVKKNEDTEEKYA